MISVCIASYNGEKYIKRQLDSILIQIKENDEVVISDDGSTDGTVDIINSYQDSRIKLLIGTVFRNPVLNMENALKNSIGDIIFLADQDDIWLSSKVGLMATKLLNYDLVISNGFIIDQDETVIHQSYFEWNRSGSGFIRNLFKNSYIGCALAFNRSLLNKALPFPQRHIMHDFWIGLLAELTGKVCFIDKQLFCYRRHADNYTVSIDKEDDKLSDFSIFYKIKYRTLVLFYLFKRILKIKYEILLKKHEGGSIK